MDIAQEKHHLRSCIQRVCTGPEYSKNLPYEDAHRAMNFILSGKADPVQIAVLLVGLRMKRETIEENRGMLQAILDNTNRQTAQVEHLVDVADAYNGHVRGLPVIAFLPAVLAACGLAAVTHGVKSVGPKFGITTARVLQALEINTALSPSQAVKKIEDPTIGWAYIDQKSYCQPLYELIPLRTIIVKRTLLTTLECIIGPVRGQQTSLLTGYVHKAYPPVYSDLARFAGFDHAIIVRGVEGGIIPSLQQTARVYYFQHQGADQYREVSAATLGMKHNTRATPLPKQIPLAEDVYAQDAPPFDIDAAVQATVQAGLAALDGKSGSSKDALIYIAAITLLQCARADSLSDAADMARQAIESGKARAHFQAMKE